MCSMVECMNLVVCYDPALQLAMACILTCSTTAAFRAMAQHLVDCHYQARFHLQADRATQELPSLVAPISRGLNAAVDRLSLLEHTSLKAGDAVQTNDLEKALARYA